MSWYTQAFGAHYPWLYRHRDAREAARCLDLLPRLAPLGAGPVLDLGCGQGRHLGLLATRGLPAVGLDLSPQLLALARAADPGQRLVRGDMRAIPCATGSCTAVLSLFTAFGYFRTPTEHAAVVHDVARVLAPAGHWFLDFLNSERVALELAAGPRETVREDGPVTVREHRRLAADPRRAVKDVTVTVRGDDEAAAALGVPREGLRYAEEVELFRLDELDALADAARLRRVAAAGDYDGGPLAPTSPRWLLVFERAKETP